MRKPGEGERVFFFFAGKRLEGMAGEPLAAALWRNGIRVLGRRRKGSPRGLFCGMGQCYECRVVIDGVRNQRACITPLKEGLDVWPQEEDVVEDDL